MQRSLLRFVGQPILVIEAGGTNFRAGWLIVNAAGKLEILHHAKYPDKELDSVEHGVSRFLHELLELNVPHATDAPTYVCCAAAGPVRDGRCVFTNLGWEVSTVSLANAAALPPARVVVVNDMVAHAHGARLLDPSSLLTLNAGMAEPNGPIAVIAAGTGLGKIFLVYVKEIGRYVAMSSEGGHVNWGPANSLEEDLLRYLRLTHKRVTAETLLSGRGLENIFRFLLARQRDEVQQDYEHLFRLAAESGKDLAVVIGDSADTHAVCHTAIEMFVDIYGAEAGNTALTGMASGGFYVAGGIGPRLKDYMVANRRFMVAFESDGVPEAHSQLLQRVPVNLVMSDDAGLLGGAYCALFNTEDQPHIDNLVKRL